MDVPTVTFSNGYKMPMFGLGTYASKGDEVEQAVINAIDFGYRHIDTAHVYENEEEIGRAIRKKIKDGTVKREDLFITTKLWNNYHEQELVVPMCKQSLRKLGLDYVDLYLIHWPVAFKECDNLWPLDSNGRPITADTDYLETWRGMEECVRQGLTKSIGVSNFNSVQMKRIIDEAKIVPVNNQVEVSVNLNQQKLIDYCKKYNITVTGYSPLSRPGRRHGIENSLGKREVIAIAKKYKKTPAQIALRFVFQQGAAPIPKSVDKSRIKENIEIFDFSLTDNDMKSIRSIGTGKRISALEDCKDHKYYPFSLPF